MKTNLPPAPTPFRIGVLSDTHGHLPEALASLFHGLDLILHAGDIDCAPVLEALGQLAKVVAVRGNMDGGPWAAELPQAEILQMGPISVYVRHDLARMDLDPAAAGIQVVIHGHTHQSQIERKEGIMYLNPGSAVWPRYGQAPSVALLTIEDQALKPRLIQIGRP